MDSEKQVNIGRCVCVSSGKEQLSSVTDRWRVQAHDLVPLGFMRLGTSGRSPGYEDPGIFLPWLLITESLWKEVHYLPLSIWLTKRP